MTSSDSYNLDAAKRGAGRDLMRHPSQTLPARRLPSSPPRRTCNSLLWYPLPESAYAIESSVLQAKRTERKEITGLRERNRRSSSQEGGVAGVPTTTSSNQTVVHHQPPATAPLSTNPCCAGHHPRARYGLMDSSDREPPVATSLSCCQHKNLGLTQLQGPSITAEREIRLENKRGGQEREFMLAWRFSGVWKQFPASSKFRRAAFRRRCYYYDQVS